MATTTGNPARAPYAAQAAPALPAVGRRQRLRAKCFRPRDADRRATCLEAAGGVQPLILQPHLRAKLHAQPRDRQEGRRALAQRHAILWPLDG